MQRIDMRWAEYVCRFQNFERRAHGPGATQNALDLWPGYLFNKMYVDPVINDPENVMKAQTFIMKV